MIGYLVFFWALCSIMNIGVLNTLVDRNLKVEKSEYGVASTVLAVAAGPMLVFYVLGILLAEHLSKIDIEIEILEAKKRKTCRQKPE